MKIPKLSWWLVLIASVISPHVVRAQQERFDEKALRQKASGGDSQAEFELGLRYLGGEGIDKDEKKAAEWLLKAANKNHPGALNAMGTLHEEGTGVAKDEKKAFEYFQKGAKYGDAMAQLNLAECYEKGRGVEKNIAESKKWLMTAANQNHPQAQMAYAWKLEHGEGTDKNTHEAAQWYLRAAEQGFVAAMTHLAYMYYTGTGVPLDYRRCEAWYRLAATSEDPMSHNDLAWFLSTCPDDKFHDAETAVEFARSAVDKVKDSKKYEVIDTLAAALARSGKFGEAAQTQMQAIVLLSEDKRPGTTPEERAKLEKELSNRLSLYQKRQPFSDDQPKPEANTKPLVDDKVLQMQGLPGRKNQPPSNDGKRGKSKKGGVIS